MLTIREAVPSDAVQIAHIQHVTWLATYVNKEHGIEPADIEAQSFESPERIAHHVDSINGTNSWKIWVAEVDGKVVGFNGVNKGEEINYQGGCYILPEYQGQGIGSELIKKSYAALGSDKPIECGVATFNENALKFWKKQGFEVVGKDAHPLKSGKTLPLVKMLRPLKQ